MTELVEGSSPKLPNALYRSRPCVTGDEGGRPPGSAGTLSAARLGRSLADPLQGAAT